MYSESTHRVTAHAGRFTYTLTLRARNAAHAWQQAQRTWQEWGTDWTAFDSGLVEAIA